MVDLWGGFKFKPRNVGGKCFPAFMRICWNQQLVINPFNPITGRCWSSFLGLDSYLSYFVDGEEKSGVSPVEMENILQFQDDFVATIVILGELASQHTSNRNMGPFWRTFGWGNTEVATQPSWGSRYCCPTRSCSNLSSSSLTLMSSNCFLLNESQFEDQYENCKMVYNTLSLVYIYIAHSNDIIWYLHIPAIPSSSKVKAKAKAKTTASSTASATLKRPAGQVVATGKSKTEVPRTDDDTPMTDPWDW